MSRLLPRRRVSLGRRGTSPPLPAGLPSSFPPTGTGGERLKTSATRGCSAAGPRAPQLASTAHRGTSMRSREGKRLRTRASRAVRVRTASVLPPVCCLPWPPPRAEGALLVVDALLLDKEPSRGSSITSSGDRASCHPPSRAQWSGRTVDAHARPSLRHTAASRRASVRSAGPVLSQTGRNAAGCGLAVAVPPPLPPPDTVECAAQEGLGRPLSRSFWPSGLALRLVCGLPRPLRLQTALCAVFEVGIKITFVLSLLHRPLCEIEGTNGGPGAGDPGRL